MTALVPNLSDQVLNTSVYLEFGWTVWTIILGEKEEAGAGEREISLKTLLCPVERVYRPADLIFAKIELRPSGERQA